jgi:hypothetical protein
MSYSWGAARNLPAIDRPRVTVVVDGHDGDVEPVQMHKLAAQLAPMVGTWQRLLDEHTPNRGGRCMKCTKGGTGVPSTLWPCVVYRVAELARRRHGRGVR